MTTPLPVDLTYGTVRWRAVGISEDGVDADRNPEAAQINGTMTFTATPPAIKYNPPGELDAITILPRPLTFPIVNGVLQTDNGQADVGLIGNDSPYISPRGWNYRADWSLTDGYTFGTFFFSLPGNVTIDLSEIAPELEVETGTLYVQGPPGPPGQGLNILGSFADVSELPATATNGDGYLIGGDLYVWDGDTWNNVGQIQGPEGPEGPIGLTGPQGPSGTISSATAITLAAGAAATVSLGGTPETRTIQFGIPQGAKGDQGIQGIQGDVGPTGPAGQITGATAVGLAAGASPTVTLGGTASVRTFQFGIPKGDKGDQGIQGVKGDQGIQGVQGPSGTITSATATGLAAGATPTITLGGTPEARTMAFGIPKGDKGDQGPAGAGAPDATTTTKGSVQLAGDLAGTAAAPTVPGLAGKANTSHTHASTDIVGSTTTGRSLIAATDAANARSIIGAGTSSLVLGTTAGTAKAGDYAPPSDGAAGTPTMRTLGTGATQAAAGNDSRLSDARTPLAHTHATTDLTGTTAIGRSLLAAADAAGIRTISGAGRVDSDGTILNVVKLTQAAYDALGTKVATTLYVIVG